jgi:hypothetical protein
MVQFDSWRDIIQAPTKAKRGFASMSPEKQRAISSKGGQNVPIDKRSFSRNAIFDRGRAGAIVDEAMENLSHVDPHGLQNIDSGFKLRKAY